MNFKKGILVTIVALSLGLNLAVTFIAVAWWLGRTHPIPVNPEEMHQIIRKFSINSASEWRLIEVDPERLIIEYRLPPYDITRYALPSRYFRLSDNLKNVDTPYLLSLDECDLFVSESGESSADFKCMKLRDFSSGTE